MELTIKTEDATNKMWFHQGFLSGGDDYYEYELTCGAGCGNDKIIFNLKDKKTGKSVREFVSMKEVFTDWVGKAIEKLKEQGDDEEE